MLLLLLSILSFHHFFSHLYVSLVCVCASVCAVCVVIPGDFCSVTHSRKRTVQEHTNITFYYVY